MNELTHINSKGKAEMVDVSEKKNSVRTAKAFAKVIVSSEVFEKIKENKIAKGDVLTTAKLAGVQAAKKTSDLIPLCHNIFITKVDVDLQLKDNSVEITSFAKTNTKTGIEMEALTAATVASLTIYDMCKAIDKSIEITSVRLLEKTGGKSGDYKAKDT